MIRKGLLSDGYNKIDNMSSKKIILDVVDDDPTVSTPLTKDDPTKYSGNNFNDILTPKLEQRPSLVRRLSSSFVPTIERRASVGTMGITSQFDRYVPQINNIIGRGPTLQETYFCNICFMNQPKNEGFELRTCGHTYCQECFKGYLTSKINDGQTKIKCFYPMNNNNNNNENKSCGCTLDEQDIQQCVSTETWDKFIRFKTQQSSKWARECPYCNHQQIGNENNPKMKCEKCGKLYCLYHSNAHDMNETCESYDLRHIKETKMNEEVIGKETKSCPGCGLPIYKNGGCNHMKCIKCGCSFCWLCLEIIEDVPVPTHFKDGGCKQFDDHNIPGYIIWLLVIFSCIFCLPSTALAIILGTFFFPIAYIFRCCIPSDDPNNPLSRNINKNNRPNLSNVVNTCFVGWIIFFFIIVIMIPLCIFTILVKILICLYNILRHIFCCLPECPQTTQMPQQQNQQSNNNLLPRNNISNNNNNNDINQ